MLNPDEPTLRVLPGQWRPQYPFEHITWISPAWHCPDHVWLDFPEAVFVDDELLYLSHVNVDFPCRHRDLPAVAWHGMDRGIGYQRELPSGLTFAGRLQRVDDHAVRMTLRFTNHSPRPLRKIFLQTCAYLRQVYELADFSHANVHVHSGGSWLGIKQAREQPREDGRYMLGWRSGPRTCDWPVIACTCRGFTGGLAMTWFDHTSSLIGNPNHPCMHADPFVHDLAPGASDTLVGVLRFFDFPLEALDYKTHLMPYRT